MYLFILVGIVPLWIKVIKDENLFSNRFQPEIFFRKIMQLLKKAYKNYFSNVVFYLTRLID